MERGTCKYGEKCNKPICPFDHPHGRLNPMEEPNPKTKEIFKTKGDCKFGDECKRENCRFSHPKDKRFPSTTDEIKSEDIEPSTKVKKSHERKKHQKDFEEIKSEDQKSKPKHPRKERSPKQKNEKEEKIHSIITEGEATEDINPDENICSMGDKCLDFYCTEKHPHGRLKPCFNGLKCQKPKCQFLHPKERKGICPQEKACKIYECDLLHPPGRPRKCRNNEKCIKPDCKMLHCSLRKENCKDCENCKIYDCQYFHSAERKKCCKRGINCKKENCDKLHPPKPDPCEKLADCIDFNCKLFHPPDRVKTCSLKCKNAFCEYLHPAQWNPALLMEEASKNKNLRNLQERNEYRQINKLPIFNYKQDLISRLKKEKVLVVTGPSGSGKSTQIPQFIAEEFPGLIVCTNPYPMATIAIAQRIANEFDNTSVGENVGYKIEGGKGIKGRKIQVITDSNLVRSRALKDPILKAINVLIIDEAEKRTLNTDLAIGIAKGARDQRPDDFYVVIIASNSESKEILDLFFGKNCGKPSFNLPNNLYQPNEEENLKEDSGSFDYLVPAVIDARKKYPEGNCLVFLAGIFEINEAIKEIKRQTKDKYECYAFYENLPPEELSNVLSSPKEISKIIFCTEFAESSFRIPNVKLVIDTGMIKQIKYDPKRRLTVTEQIYISKDQRLKRKACAGCYEDGVYISLYSLQCLTKEEIEPQILRSSLDSVVLFLMVLKYDPMGFPFITKPKEEFLMSSYELLKEFECVDNSMITPKGRLFLELPFDLRMNNFVTLGHEIYDEIENFAIIASILSSPDSLFLMRGGDVKKDIAKANIMEIASKHNSDLELLLETFMNWYDSGICKGIVCEKCNRPIPKKDYDGCRFCRSNFAQQNKLNKRALERVLATKNQVLKLLKNFTNQEKKKSNIPITEKIGRGLIASFKEHIGELLFPENPSIGVHLLDGGEKGSFNSTSTFLQKSQKNITTIIAMSITNLPNGYYILDQVHPILSEWIPEKIMQKFGVIKKDIQECLIYPNCNGKYRSLLLKELKSVEKDQSWASFTIILYENLKLNVYGPKADSHAIQAFCQSFLCKQIKEDLDYETNLPVSNGTAIVSLGSGMHINNIQPGTSTQLRFTLESNIKTKEEFIKWLCANAGLKEIDIKWCNFIKRKMDDEKSLSFVGFGDEKAAAKARTLKQASFQHSQEEMSKTVVLTIPHISYDKEKIEEKLNALENIPAKIWEPSPPYFQIQLKKFNNLFKNGEDIKKTLSIHQFENLVDMDIHGKKFGYLKFINKESRDKAYMKLLTQPVSLQIEANDNDLKSRLFIRFPRTEEAQAFYKSGYLAICPQTLSCEGFETVRVERAHLFSRLNEYLQSISTNFKCKFEIKKDKKNVIKKNTKGPEFTKVIFNGASPIVVGQAGKQLLKIIAPMSLKFGTKQQRTLMKEINDLDLLDEWDQALGLEHKVFEDDKTGDIFKLEIYGDQMMQGAFMAKILEYSDVFNPRYNTVAVPNNMNFMFKKNMIGWNFMQKLNKELGNCAIISFAYFENVVEIYVKPENNNLIEKTIQKVQVFIKEHSSEDEKKEIQDETMNSCVFCQKAGGQPFSICGHHYCTNCLSDEAKTNGPLLKIVECKKCQTAISIKDIKYCFSEDDFANLAQNIVKVYLTQNNDSPMCLCPGATCQALKVKVSGYSICVWCETGYCPLCGEQNNSYHEGKTCQEYKEFRKTMAECPIYYCRVLREKILGYSRCDNCSKYSCPLCGEQEKVYHEGRTCVKYQEILKTLLLCPIPSCGYLREKKLGYSFCPNCKCYSCPLCGEKDMPYHQNKTCLQFQEILKTLISCPIPGCKALREKKLGYSNCFNCKKNVCPFCGAKDQPLHQAKTCFEYQELLKNSIPCPNSQCKAMREKKLGYSICLSCQIASCPLCGESDNACHEGRNCKEYQEKRASLLSCPNSFCKGLREKSSGYSLCFLCKIESCPLCGEMRNPYHREKTCHEYQEFKKTLVSCPVAGCKAFREKQYSICFSCNIPSCTICGAENTSLHMGKTCKEYIEEVKKRFSGLDVHNLFARAQKFVTNEWDSIQLSKPYRVEINLGLEAECPSMQKFCSAIQKVGSNPLKNGFFAWHGTNSEAGVVGICHTGFDPSRRRGQAYGRGEYFGQNVTTSHSYAGGSCRMIVAFLLKVSETSTHGNFCYVVDNPTDFKLAYNLPVLVITYLKDLPPVQFKNFLKNYNVEKTMGSWVPAFRWSWLTDAGSFQPYNDQINNMIEREFTLYQENKGGSQFETSPITRFVDDLPQKYRVDFINYNQENLKSGFKRKIQRNKIDLPSSNIRWQFQNEQNQWQNFELLVLNQIEQAFIKYYQFKGDSCLRNLHFPGRPESYIIDFVNGMQVNESNNHSRNVRRISI